MLTPPSDHQRINQDDSDNMQEKLSEEQNTPISYVEGSSGKHSPRSFKNEANQFYGSHEARHLYEFCQ